MDDAILPFPVFRFSESRHWGARLASLLPATRYFPIWALVSRCRDLRSAGRRRSVVRFLWGCLRARGGVAECTGHPGMCQVQIGRSSAGRRWKRHAHTAEVAPVGAARLVLIHAEKDIGSGRMAPLLEDRKPCDQEDVDGGLIGPDTGSTIATLSTAR